MDPFARNLSLFGLAFAIAVMILSPGFRSQLWDLFEPSRARKVLATLELKVETNDYRVVKIRQNRSILVEIYQVAENGLQELNSRFEIPNSQDVFYEFQRSMSNLFSTNLDEDPEDEVVIPVLDENLVAKFNVIKFNAETKSFQHFAFE